MSFSKLRLAWLRQYRIAVAGMIELQTIATDTVAPLPFLGAQSIKFDNPSLVH